MADQYKQQVHWLMYDSTSTQNLQQPSAAPRYGAVVQRN